MAQEPGMQEAPPSRAAGEEATTGGAVGNDLTSSVTDGAHLSSLVEIPVHLSITIATRRGSGLAPAPPPLHLYPRCLSSQNLSVLCSS